MFKPERTNDVSVFPPEQEGTIDPREYFYLTSFQKLAENLDDEPSHHWERVQNRYAVLNDQEHKQVVALGEVIGHGTTSDDVKRTLLVAEKYHDRQSTSAEFEISNNAIGVVFDAFREVAPYLSHEQRHEFVQAMVRGRTALKEYDPAHTAEFLTRTALEQLPDDPQGAEIEKLEPFVAADGEASSQQMEELQKFFELVGRKMPADKFAEQVAAFRKETRLSDGVFGAGYAGVFLRITGEAFASREDTARTHGLMDQEKPREYPIDPLVTRSVESPAALAAILKEMPFESVPDTRSMKRSAPRAELVDLELVVGVTATTGDWSVSAEANRGPEKIWELMEALRAGTARIRGGSEGQDDPILAVEIDGKYYIENGRHRVAAVKALGVPRIPMLVERVER